jgi:RHS repeat-associated protein
MNKAYFSFLALVITCAATTSRSERVKTAFGHSVSQSAQDFHRLRVFEEPLVPVGGEPSVAENAALAGALFEYSKRTTPDDFASLTEFLIQHPNSPWRASLLTCLGLEYYNTAYYSRALEAWEEAWSLGQKAADVNGKFLADRTVCELAGLYSRLGRMTELEALLNSIEHRLFLGGATERIKLAREALSMMKYQPGISFRCGPLALQSILLSDQRLPESSATNAVMAIFNSASTQQGFSLSQVAELSKKIDLNYQMAFREKRGVFVVPSVVHWKAGHYAAIVRQVGDRYLVEDPTFVNTVWATRQALEAETSGYFLIPPGDLPPGWREVNAKEGASVWGKGVTSGIDPDNYTPEDLEAGSCPLEGASGSEPGMAISRVHLGLANLQIRDTPVGYTPPVGPPVRFTVRYNHRDYIQKPSRISRILGPRWTHDWNAWIGDFPVNPLADVKYYVGGGGARTFTGFNTNTQTFAPQQLDQTRLKRTSLDTYEMTFPDGSMKIFGLRPDGGVEVLLTQVVDPAGNAVSLSYDDNLRLVALTDAIGQVTTISYENPTNSNLITKVTDPFGRFATFDYTMVTFLFTNCCPTNVVPIGVAVLSKITDVLGLESQFEIQSLNGFIPRMLTPYGATTFSAGEGGGPNQTTRFVESRYPDGTRDRIEFNQNANSIASSDPPGLVPQGVSTFNQYLYARNTFYWNRSACAKAYRDYSKARIYHWLHTPNIALTAGILESTKEPLEGRVWYNYAGQVGPHLVGNTDRPSRVGRVLDDGTTQLYRYVYNEFGHETEMTDPIGRKFRFLYATNGIDLLEARQIRGVNNELLFRATYSPQHRPLTLIDAAGQTTIFTYNARGQLLTETNPKNETTTYAYNSNGYLIAVDGPLPGTNDLFTTTYDAFGRTRTLTDESGHVLTFAYDNMDRLTRLTHLDATFSQFIWDRLDLVATIDRAGRPTLFDYDSMGQMTEQTDPSGRVTRFQWCSCGSLGSLIDPMGRMTEWDSDVQGRPVNKRYGDGSTVRYFYENTTSRLRQIIDEKQQVTQYAYNRDDTLKSIMYPNARVPTAGVSYAYDRDYQRLVSMTDGIGTTRYSYVPVTGNSALGAGRLASVDGPLPEDTISYAYDELGRRVSTAINNGVASTMSYDAAGRLVGETNALGTFAYGYDGTSRRLSSRFLPNSQVEERQYGGNLLDHTLQRVTHRTGAGRVSEFLYGHDVPAGRITTWSQQVGAQPPLLHTFGYDDADQLISVSVSGAGGFMNAFAYRYDPAGNRLSEQVGATNHASTYNALNQISTSTAPGTSRTNEWDGENRLTAVIEGNQRTEFTYDGYGRRVAIRQLLNGTEVSHRRFIWCGTEICEERDAAGTVTKRFFPQGVKLEAGPMIGTYFYTRDHLGSIRELTDAGGNVRTRYAYDPYGRRTKLTGDVEADFGFAGMFWTPEAGLSLTLFRAYDAGLGRWLSRDPLNRAELSEGPNLYAYVGNDPINEIDPLGLACAGTPCLCARTPGLCAAIAGIGAGAGATVQRVGPAAQAAGQQIARCGQYLYGRVQAIAERIPDAFGEAQAFLRNPDYTTTDRFLAIRNIAYPASPQLVFELQIAFDEVVVALATRYGLSLEQARAWLTWLTGGDPTRWGL